MNKKSWRPWQQGLQSIIFALLMLNACLLAARVAPPFFGYPALFGAEPAPLLDMAIPAGQNTALLFGNMRLQTEEGLSLGKAILLINGQSAGDFAAGELTVRVYEGDTLAIDGSAYKCPLHFFIRAVSSNINSAALPDNLTTNGDSAVLPAITFK